MIDLIGGAPTVIALVKVLVAFVLLLLTTLLVVWAERKIIADMQARIGPNRWGPFGLLQTLADGIKLFFKEDFRPRTRTDGRTPSLPSPRWFPRSWPSP